MHVDNEDVHRTTSLKREGRRVSQFIDMPLKRRRKLELMRRNSVSNLTLRGREEAHDTLRDSSLIQKDEAYERKI